MTSSRLALIGGILFAAALAPHAAWSQAGAIAPRPAFSQQLHHAQPGSINYVEGEAASGSQPLGIASIGSVALGKGQTLTTRAGKAEILLTPGAILRLSDNSSVKLVATEMANVEVELVKGRAFVQAMDIPGQTKLWVAQHGTTTRLLKAGLYDFDADHDQLRVFKGEAEVRAGNQEAKLGDSRMIALAAGNPLKAQDFQTGQYEDDDFYRWTALRSGMLPEAPHLYGRPGPG